MRTKTLRLEVRNASSQSDINLYKYFLNYIEPKNPYYKIELLNINLEEGCQLLYFVYLHENQPLILMPFYLREIIISEKNTSYFDVISPYGYTGPLFKENIDGRDLKLFWHQVDTWYRNNAVVTEFIRFNFNSNHLLYSGALVQSLKNVRGKILEENILWDNFKYSVRKNIQNAKKNELRFEVYFKDIHRSKIEEFYSIYIGTMNRNIASDAFYYSMDYFVDFISNNPENCALAIVYKDDIAISAELLLLSKDSMFSFLGGTNAVYFNFRPNDFLKIETLNWGRKQGFTYYVLGGGRADNDSLYRYKKKFFPNDSDLVFYTGRKILNNNVYEELVQKVYTDQLVPMSDDITKGFFPKYRDVKPKLYVEIDQEVSSEI